MAASGNVRYSQIRSGDKTGSGNRIITAASGALTQNVPLLYNASGDVVATATRSGNTTEFATITGTKTTGEQLAFDASGNIIASGTAIGGGGAGFSGSRFDYYEAPPTTSWSWVNQNSTTVTTVRDALSFVVPQKNVTGSTLYVRTGPSAPWTLTAKIFFNIRDTNFFNHGICARESSTGKFVSCGIGNGTVFRYGRWADPNTLSVNTDLTASTFMTGLQEVYIRLEDNNTDLIAYVGDGQNFYEIARQGRTAHMAGGADQLGLIFNKNNSTGTYDYPTLVSWYVA